MVIEGTEPYGLIRVAPYIGLLCFSTSVVTVGHDIGNLSPNL
jgi:hypothetical protein